MSSLICPHCKKEVDFSGENWAVESDKDTCEHCGGKFYIEHECSATDDGGCIEYLIKGT